MKFVLLSFFSGCLKKNIMTFNPGWDENAQILDSFTDIRNIQKQLKDEGIKIETEIDESTSGPTSFIIVNPDGNTILLDQHV